MYYFLATKIQFSRNIDVSGASHLFYFDIFVCYLLVLALVLLLQRDEISCLIAHSTHFFSPSVIHSIHTMYKNLLPKEREKKVFLFYQQHLFVYETSDRVCASANAGEGLWKNFVYEWCVLLLYQYTYYIYISCWLPKISGINAEVLLTWAFKLNDLECKRPSQRREKKPHTHIHTHIYVHINHQSRHPFDWISCDFRIVTYKSIDSSIECVQAWVLIKMLNPTLLLFLTQHIYTRPLNNSVYTIYILSTFVCSKSEKSMRTYKTTVCGISTRILHTICIQPSINGYWNRERQS